MRLFKAKSFLTVRNETDSFFLCRAVNAVYEDSKRCKIQWLEDVAPNKYSFSSVDWIQPLSIIAKVQVKRVADSDNLIAIEEKDLTKVTGLLEKIKETGHLTMDSSELDESDENGVTITATKKSKKTCLDNDDLFDKEDSQDRVDVAMTTKVKHKKLTDSGDEEIVKKKKPADSVSGSLAVKKTPHDAAKKEEKGEKTPKNATSSGS